MKKGDYVLATKYSDGDPWDGWAVGFFDGMLHYKSGDRFMVIDSNGHQFRGNGFRRCEKITPDEGEAIIKFDRSIVNEAGYYPNEPIINLWDILDEYRKQKPSEKSNKKPKKQKPQDN